MNQKEDVEHKVAKGSDNKNNLFITSIKNTINFSKIYSGALLAIIYAIGSATQIFELARINPSYIKFFSISQLLVDGAFIITFTITIYISFIVFSIAIGLTIPTKLIRILKNHKNPESFRLTVKGVALSLLPFLPLFFLTIYDIRYYKNQPFFMVVFASFLCAVLAEFVQYSYEYDDHINRLIDKFADTPTDDTKIGLGAIYRFNAAVVTIISFLLLTPVILDFYRLPTNLDNFDKAKQLVMTDYKYLKLEDINIRYFNDKFMFIEITKPDKRKSIVIYETNSALFDTRVITLNEN